MTKLPSAINALPFYESWVDAPELAETFDPFSYRNRVASYRLLIEATNRDKIYGADNSRNPLWGLLFQLSWQHRTGRLGVSTEPTDVIDPDAPWGYGNFALNAVPLVGAIDAALVSDLAIREPSHDSRFQYAHGGGVSGGRHVPPEFSPAVDDWRGFFELVQKTEPGDDLEPLLFAMWKAHKNSLDVIRTRIADIEPRHYSLTEIRFLSGWCRMVDYLWAAAWPTDFEFMLENGSDVLPERVLTDDDRSGDMPDMTPRVQRNVRNVLRIADTPNWRYKLNLRLWQRAMRTRNARNEVVEMLDALFNPTPENKPERRRLLMYTIGIRGL